MPPRPKFTKERVIETALDITRDSGIDAVTARELSIRLKASASPLFTLFSSIDEIRSEVRNLAMKMFAERTMEALSYTPAFKQFGMLMISFASEEPRLFKVLFMEKKEGVKDFSDFSPELGECFTSMIEILKNDYDLTDDEAGFLFNQMWIYTYGISVFCACGVCSFSDEDISRMLGQQFTATIRLIKSGKMDLATPVPVKKGQESDISSFSEILK